MPLIRSWAVIDIRRRRVALSICRIAQECLTNATSHGRPSEVRVRINAHSPDAVELSVEDDGGGDPADLHTRMGHGILGIRERLAALGGKFMADAAPRGVWVSALIPFGGAPEVAA